VRTFVRLRLPRRAVTSVAVIGLVGLAVGATPLTASASDPLTDAQNRVTEATRAANAAASAYNDAQTRYYSLQDAIQATERDVHELEVQQAQLIKVAHLRALTAYKGGATGLEDLVGLNDADVMDAARRATLLDRVNARGNQAIAQLQQVSDQLDAKETALRKETDKQKDVLANLKQMEDATTQTLADAQRAEQQLRDYLEAQHRIAEFTAAVAKARAAARATGASESGGGAPGQIIGTGSWVCPVQGPRSFTNDWHEARSGHVHHGTDIFSPRGTPVVAPEAGTLFFQADTLGGNAAYVTSASNTTYYMAHLNDYVGGGRSVARGEVVGHVGNTGDAAGGPTHVHFEIRLGGPNGTKINPYPTLAAHC
jgi:murein DD-endopeptidase MepM/ murein hydrolase activator NlpD